MNNQKTKRKSNSEKQRADWWLSEVGQGVGEMDEDGQKVQTSGYEIHKCW